MGDEVLKKFGRYFLLDRIAQGGMAEIYRARLATPDGGGRLMVIKRVIAGFGGNKEFLEMFKSEIKVTMGFNHPNIVQVYDFGEEAGQPYIAMEIVDGKNVRQFAIGFAQVKQMFPIELTAYIVSQAAAGLHYAHTFKDKITNAPLNIVHRDISPQNILISYDGSVKVIDFGIAKATTNSENTRSGIIKGKPSYLSPEQIAGEALDGRSDLFALGIVLWELLTGKKLFTPVEGNDFAVLKQIENCQTHVKAPSTINPNIPKDLDYIVLRSLAKQREKRFQSAEEFQRALNKFLTPNFPDFDPSDLSYTAKRLFKDDIVRDRKLLQLLNGKAEELLASSSSSSDAELVASPPDRAPEEQKPVPKTSGARSGASQRIELDSSAIKKHAPIEMDPESTRISRARPGIARPGNPSMTHSPFPPTQQGPYVSPAKGGGGMLAALLAAGLAVVVFGPQFGIEIPGVTPWVQQFISQSAKPEKSAATRVKPAQAPVAEPERPESKDLITLQLNVTPKGGGIRIMLNGKELDSTNPAARVPLNEPLELVAEHPDFRVFRREFVLSSDDVGGLKQWSMDVPLEPLSFGFLTIQTTPSADAFITGVDRGPASEKPWVYKTPIENEKFPVGTYKILLENNLLGMRKSVVVQVKDGASTKVEERLEVKP